MMEEEWDRLFNLDLKGIFSPRKTWQIWLNNTGGFILNTGSLATKAWVNRCILQVSGCAELEYRTVLTFDGSVEIEQELIY
jgi:hypothetical protein